MQEKDLTTLIIMSTHNAKAQFELGNYYHNHNKQDLANECYKKSADQGYAEAQYHLGYIFENQSGIEFSKLFLDPNKRYLVDLAQEYYKKAADQGFTEAQYRLGNLFEKQGKTELAREYYTKAAQKCFCAAFALAGLDCEAKK